MLATGPGRFSLIGLLCLAALVSPGLRAQLGPPPFVRSANNSADYSTTFAQGSLFVVFGENLGPATLVEVTAFPLPDILAGTSVTVTSGTTTLNCPLVYTSASQVAAILPSNTPIGTATIAVTYNGQAGPAGFSGAQVTVAATSVGLYTLTSSGLGAGSLTDLDGTLLTFANSAKPGDDVYLYGTGLGPIGTPDNLLPPSFPNFPNVQVFVAGQSATIVYGGRSGCCSGVDQIVFTVPAAVANGCNVPITVVSGGVASNPVTMPVNAAGGPCSDSGPTLPTSVLTKASAGQPVRVGIVSVGPTAIAGVGSNYGAVAASLSAALHTPVSEADAARLIRAYRTRSSRAIRMAMAKYTSRWKAVDAKTKARLVAQISLTQEGAFAEFGSLSSESATAMVTAAQFPPAGECAMLPNSVPYGLGSIGAGLNAGASLTLSGAAGSLTLKRTGNGQYQAPLDASAAGPNVPLGAYTISGSGGNDVGAFSATVTIASHPAISNKSSLASVDPAQPLTVTWTGGIAGNYVLIGGGSTTPPHGYFACAADGGQGTFTIPSYILSAIPATTTANGIIFISPHPLSNQLSIPGVDLAYFADASNDSVNVAFGKTTGNGPNVANVTGSIDGLYPASGAAAARNDGMSTGGPISNSALLTAATFTTAFDILPNASPFVVTATSAAGSATIMINPAQNTWQANYVVPAVAARAGDFSGDFTVTNFLTGSPFPGNLIPVSLLDPIAVSALSYLVLPNAFVQGSPNGTLMASGTLPASGHFTIGPGANPPQTFGGFSNLTTRGSQSATFSLYVDGKLVASKQVPFSTD